MKVHVIILKEDKKVHVCTDRSEAARVIKMSPGGLGKALKRDQGWYEKNGFIVALSDYAKSKRGKALYENRIKKS